MSAPFAFLNGEIIPTNQAKISVGDIAIGRGYGIFDYFQVINGVPLFMSEHLDRFIRSANFMSLRVDYNKDDLVNAILDLLDKNQITIAGIKLLATGGESSDGFSMGKANVAILVLPYYEPSEELVAKGVKLISYEYQRLLPHIKTTNYLYNVYLSQELKAADAIEPLYYTSESVRETARANIFAVIEGRLVTCRDKVLSGINREKVLKMSYPTELRNITLKEMKNADEVFLTGTTKRVIGVYQIDDQVIGDGKPGPITKEIRKKLLDQEQKIIKAFQQIRRVGF